MRTLAIALCLLLCACDDGAPSLDPDPTDGAAGADAERDAGDPLDQGALDHGRDASRADAALDASLLDGAVIDAARPDGAPADAALVDAAALDGDLPDRGGPDDGAPDAGALDAQLLDGDVLDGAAPDQAPRVDAGAPSGFVEGEARAADGRTVVTVSAGAVRVEADPDGRFRLGPLPPGPVELLIEAPRHQGLTRAAEVEAEATVALDAPVLLYRGRRIGPAAGAQLRFSFDAEWVIWSEGDALWTRGTAPGAAPRELLARAFEVFLGFVPGQAAITVRRRVEVGLAGDIEVIDLADGRRRALFEEAQPWVRWRGEAALGMVGTRDGLSTLVLGRPGAAPRVLGEGVPWLLVTELADGEPAWAQRADDAFAIWRGGDAVMAEQIAPAQASDAFLMTTPGRAGLMWLETDATLTRWAADTGIDRVARDVRAAPRPRFIPQGLLFWRDDPAEEGLQRLHLLADGVERALIGSVDSGTFRLIGDRYYVVRPEDGLWTGTLAGDPPARILAGERIQYVTQGRGVIALVDGAAHHVIPGQQPVDIGVDRLTTLQGLNVGATAWQSATSTLWWLPGPDQAAPAMPIVEGAPRARRTVEPGNAAVFALGPDGYLRAPIPPGMPQTVFAEVVTELVVLSAARILGWQPDAWLYGIDPQTGDATGWAASVSRVVTSSDRRFVAYVSDRGTFLVDREE